MLDPLFAQNSEYRRVNLNAISVYNSILNWLAGSQPCCSIDSLVAPVFYTYILYIYIYMCICIHGLYIHILYIFTICIIISIYRFTMLISWFAAWQSEESMSIMQIFACSKAHRSCSSSFDLCLCRASCSMMPWHGSHDVLAGTSRTSLHPSPGYCWRNIWGFEFVSGQVYVPSQSHRCRTLHVKVKICRESGRLFAIVGS